MRCNQVAVGWNWDPDPIQPGALAWREQALLAYDTQLIFVQSYTVYRDLSLTLADSPSNLETADVFSNDYSLQMKKPTGCGRGQGQGSTAGQGGGKRDSHPNSSRQIPCLLPQDTVQATRLSMRKVASIGSCHGDPGPMSQEEEGR